MQLEAYNSICAYAFEGVMPTDPMTAAVTALMRSTIDRDNDKWEKVREKRRAAIKSRWDKQKAVTDEQVNTEDTNVFTCIQDKQVNTSNTVNVNDNVNDNVNVNVIKEKKKKEICLYSELEQQFEDFRKAYPGRKRGHDTELDAFKRKYKNWAEIVPLLMPALQRLIEFNKAASAAGQWTASFANLSTWLFQARWEEELPEITSKNAAQSSIEQSKSLTASDYEEDDEAFHSKNR